MNIFKIKNRIYKYESFWREKKSQPEYDSVGKLLPYPEPGKPWQNQELFLKKLNDTHIVLRRKNKFSKYKINKECLICHEKNVTTGLFKLKNLRWEDGLYHYINVHNIKPSDEFIDYIFRYQLNPRVRTRKLAHLKGVTIQKNNITYLKIDRNQLLIIDALMKHGSSKQYIDLKSRTIYRYSEHAGLLDFDAYGLEKIIVSGRTTRVDKNDSDIYQPQTMLDMFDYEYIFHTHPATPRPGGRAKLGILYEFPSISDIFHFIDHYNKGITQGSIVVTPEGLYNIRKMESDNKKIKINEDDFYQKILKTYKTVQKEALKQYGQNFSQNTFYADIAQNKKFIDKINEILNRYHIQIDYYPRIKDKLNRWVIDTIYLPVYVTEPRFKKL